MRYLFGFLISLLLCLTASMSYAAIALESTCQSAATTVSVSSITTACTVSATSANHVMVVFTQNATIPSGNVPVTGVTFNGTAMTLGTGCHAVLTQSTNRWMGDAWYLFNPTATTADVVVTWSGTGNERAMGYTAIVLSDVEAFDKCATASATANSTITVDITPTFDNSMVIDNGHANISTAWTVGAGQTTITNRNLTGSSAEAALVSYTLQTTAVAETMSWTADGAAEWAQVAVAFKPATAGSVCRGALMLMGVGGC